MEFAYLFYRYILFIYGASPAVIWFYHILLAWSPIKNYCNRLFIQDVKGIGTKYLRCNSKPQNKHKSFIRYSPKMLRFQDAGCFKWNLASTFSFINSDQFPELKHNLPCLVFWPFATIWRNKMFFEYYRGVDTKEVQRLSSEKKNETHCFRDNRKWVLRPNYLCYFPTNLFQTMRRDYMLHYRVLKKSIRVRSHFIGKNPN